MPEGGFTDAGLLERLAAIHNEAEVAVVAGELLEARRHGTAKRVAEIQRATPIGCTI